MYAVTDRLSERLKKAHYRIRTGAEMGVPAVRFIATKTIFIFAVFSLASISIVTLEKDKAKPHDLDNLFDSGFKLAKRRNWIPLLRGMQFGYVVMPVIIGENPDEEALFYALSEPRRRFALFEVPVVIDLTGHRVAFFEGFAKWGGAIWPSVQKIVTKHIEPVVDELG